jgi:hypothetical protein
MHHHFRHFRLEIQGVSGQIALAAIVQRACDAPRYFASGTASFPLATSS